MLICFAQAALATSYSWTGSGGDSRWNRSTNWSPNGIPTSGDTVTIASGAATHQPGLDTNRAIGKFTMTSGTLNLSTWTLNITGKADFNGGTIQGTATDALQPRGTYAIFAGTTFDAQVNAQCGYIQLDGSTFNKVSWLEMTSSTDGLGNGGNTFTKKVTIKNNSSASFRIAGTYANTFSDTAIFINTSSRELRASDKGKTAFNGNIYVNSTSGPVNFGGSGGDTATLASGKIITVGSTGFSSGTLLLQRFIQSGSTAQTVSLTGSAIFNTVNSIFNGKLTVTSPSVLVKETKFYDTLSVTQTGGTNAASSGGNLFDKKVTITNHGSANLQFATDAGDTFNADVVFFTDSTGYLYPCCSDTNYVKGNLTATGSNISFKTGTGVVRFSGTADQVVSGSATLLFKHVSMNKTSGMVTLSKDIEIEGNLQFVKGVLISDTTNLVKMLAGSSVSGASDSSFVDGPVKKIGNTSFVFPVGSFIHYRPLSITAPGSSTDAFLAQYFDAGQIQGDSLDTTLTEVSPCNNWLFLRKNGSSNVSISLPWDTSYCSVFDTTYMHLAFWNDTIWKDKGHGTFSGTAASGKMTSGAAVSNYGYFTLATTVPSPPDCSTGYYSLILTGNSTGFSSQYNNNSNILITGTFTINAASTFTLYGCQNVYLHPTAVIMIASGSTLNIIKSRLQACETMWQYIEIDGSTAHLNVYQSTIADAENAIWSHNGGVYTINSRTHLNKNWKGIVIDSYGAHTGTVNSCYFECAAVPGGNQPATLLYPHLTFRTSRGIEVSDVTNITFGTSASQAVDVIFFYMDRGIDATGSTFNVYNCNFDKIDNIGYGIYAKTTSGNFTVNVGGASNTSCIFKGCSTGILVLGNLPNGAGYTPTINYNYFDTPGNAIVISNILNKTINCNYNEINYFGNGIAVNNCIRSTINIEHNNLNAPNNVFFTTYNLGNYGTTGISVLNNVKRRAIVNVNHNWITNTRTGIYASLISSTSLANFVVSYNHVYFQISYDDLTNNLPMPRVHHAIQLDQCNYADVTFNTVERLPATPFPSTTSDLSEWDRIYGIQLNNVNNSEVHCNELDYTSSGVNVRSVCNNTMLHENTFNECARGVDLGYMIVYNGGPSGTPVTINSQIDPFPPYGIGTHDTWNVDDANPGDMLRVCGMNTPTKQYRYLNTIPYYGTPTDPYFPWNLYCPLGANGSGATMVATPVPAEANSCVSLAAFSRDTIIGDIVWDTIVYSDFASHRRYMQINNAYRLLDEDTAARLNLHDGKDSMYAAFYYNIAASNIGKYHTIEKLIDDENYEDAAGILAEITDTCDMEEYRHIVLDIYLNKIVPGEELSEGELSDLDYIAHLCILEGGTAVSEARSMLGIQVNDSCIVEEERMASPFTSQEISEFNDDRYCYFAISPNPAHEVLLMNYNQQGTLSIFDVTGRKMKEVNLPVKHGNYSLSIHDLTAGLYFYSYKLLAGKSKTGKFVKE